MDILPAVAKDMVHVCFTPLAICCAVPLKVSVCAFLTKAMRPYAIASILMVSYAPNHILNSGTQTLAIRGCEGV